MTFLDILPNLLAGDKCKRASWKPPTVSEQYIFREVTPSSDKLVIMYSDGVALNYLATSEDIVKADDWEVIP